MQLCILVYETVDDKTNYTQRYSHRIFHIGNNETASDSPLITICTTIFTTRSQAVARIADHTATQQTLVISDCY